MRVCNDKRGCVTSQQYHDDCPDISQYYGDAIIFCYCFVVWKHSNINIAHCTRSSLHDPPLRHRKWRNAVSCPKHFQCQHLPIAPDTAWLWSRWWTSRYCECRRKEGGHYISWTGSGITQYITTCLVTIAELQLILSTNVHLSVCSTHDTRQIPRIASS